jgi:hypothetical protein
MDTREGSKGSFVHPLPHPCAYVTCQSNSLFVNSLGEKILPLSRGILLPALCCLTWTLHVLCLNHACLLLLGKDERTK